MAFWKKKTRSPPKVGLAKRNAALISNVADILHARKLKTLLTLHKQHCIILNANKAVGSGVFRSFSNSDKCRPEAGGDVISGVAFEYVGTDVSAGFGDSCLG